MLRDVPIVGHFTPAPTVAQLSAMDALSVDIPRQYPELAADSQFRCLMPESLDDGACLHLDDLSEITYLDGGREFRFIQDRARMRAGDGDLVASVAPEVAGYEAYCQQQLGLGAPEWLRVAPGDDRVRVAQACWKDRRVRRTLVHRMRTNRLDYLHPHMGTFGVWELGALLQQHSRRPLKVIGAPPALSRLVNHKVTFADVVSQLLGRRFIPLTASVWNMATLCERVADLAVSARMIGLKRPRSAGGDAIVILPAGLLRGQSLQEINLVLEPSVRRLQWTGDSDLLINSWETDVLCSPSAQIWIPTEADGPPIVEGIFAQLLDYHATVFVGTVEAELPSDLTREFATYSWLLARLFQRLGYVGRCSFDAILVGESLEHSRLEFVECNGRWGGASLPMTLMNRIFGDWRTKPYAARVLKVEGLSRIAFPRLLQLLRSDLYDRHTGRGRLIVTTPGYLYQQSAISVLALGESRRDASEYLCRAVPVLLKRAVESGVAVAENDGESLISTP